MLSWLKRQHVVVICSGGVVQQVLASRKHIEVEVIDFDEITEQDQYQPWVSKEANERVSELQDKYYEVW